MKINQVEPWIDAAEKKAMQKYLDSGGWLTEFKKTREFESMLAEYLGSSHVHATTSGTLALMVALMALGVGPGDEVLCPDLTMVASANAIALVGATPVLVDIDVQNLCLDLKKAEEAITEATAAMIYVDLDGRCHNMNVRAFCGKYGLYLVEDACQALGSKFNGRYLGTFGHLGCFSFSFAKIITMGEGGAIVTDDDMLSKQVSMIRDFGRPQKGVDRHEVLGLKAKITDLQAVIGIEQMKKLEWRVQRKKEIYGLYRELLDIEEVEFVDTNLDDCAPWFVDILVNDRDRLKCHLELREIGTRSFYPPIHTQPLYSHVIGDFPNTVSASSRGLWLPSSSFLKDEDIAEVCKKIKEFYGK